MYADTVTVEGKKVTKELFIDKKPVSEVREELRVQLRAAQGSLSTSLTVPVRFDTISEQKRDETKPTRPLTASESNFWSKRLCDRHSSSGFSF